jgi:HK97 family phage prohead protease
MQIHDVFSARAELKFIENEAPGTFGGLGSVFENEDHHGDVMEHGAFTETLAEHKAAGTRPAMYVEHSAFKGGDPLPIGVWTEIAQEDGGLRVKGRLVGMSSPHIQRVAELMREEPPALGGLSIAFITPPGGAIIGRKSNEPRRRLKRVKLLSIDVVGDPSNALARIDGMKSVLVQADQQAACQALGQAMELHRATMSGGNSPTVEQRTALMTHLQAAHMALTGTPMPEGMKAMPTLREFEAAIGTMFGLTNSQARAITEHGIKSWLSRDEDREQVDVASRETRAELSAALANFNLPSF